MTWDPDGIVVSDAFRDYVDDLRETSNYASGGVNAHFSEDMNHETSSDDDAQIAVTDETDGVLEDRDVGRRAFMAATAATLAAGSAGTAAAQAPTLNFGSGLVPNPEVQLTQTIEEHNREEKSSALGYINDSGEVATLADDGAEIAPRPEDDSDGNPVAHNPLSLRADHIGDREFYLTPRDRTFTNADDEEEDVTVLDERHWTVDAEVTVADADVGHGNAAISVSTDGVAADTTSSATFSEISIDETERNYLALVANVIALPADAVVDIALIDEGGSEIVVSMGDALDPAQDDVVTDSEGYGLVYQEQLGGLSGSLSEIDSIEIRVSDADVEFELTGLGLNRTSEWEFGTREFVNADDEIETETVTEPSGWFSITGLETLPDMFSTASIYELDVDMVMPAENLGEPMVDVEWREGDLYDHVGQYVFTFEVPSQFALSPTIDGLYYEQQLSDGRFETLETTVDVSDPLTVEDVDDETWTDHTDLLGDEGDELELSTLFVDGEYIVAHFEVKYHADEKEEATSGAALGGPTGREGGGILDSIFSVPGAIASAIAGLGIFRMLRGGN